MPDELEDNNFILTANKLSLVTDNQSTTIAAIKVTATNTDLMDHLIKCPLILVHAEANVTQATLSIVNYSKTISLMYQLQ